jgi:hypothetical protein
MVTIVVQRHTEPPTTPTSKAMEYIVNATAESFASALRDRVKEMKCNVHPFSNPTIKIIAGDNPTIKIERLNFCCEEFKNSIRMEGTH